ncbi:3-octaprenyl-4-hydroxybenzoate carboxy-lyase [Candidatus Pantoea edessiphila]|uniref:Flavin prenyltransferase UbiX n=1 Tax=Candidatus Pantoea edessiphila TaxID=2044610 RepID=A0A2P5SYH6_9GAMM|nr:UbiX family flavin prenyltransferase [Candidatus Pantoea edessiphila]MBK4775480.1 UbiX family flavin prenyltransferase [Pantoea sp. Edef]PPI87391.1 3-octaprenyl-4-hydroxybenzoate carboxy-lyase [Candidatus Pantoea edessiphila]
MKRLIVGISGASGIIYSLRMLQVLKDLEDIETHLIMSHSSYETLKIESDFSLSKVHNLANVVHNVKNIAASISSGSYKTIGMVILPCSIKTLSSIVNCYSDSLLTRAADVALKENRKLILCLRETPLHIGHLHMMIRASRLGAIVMPMVPAFYHNPTTIDQIINQTVNRIIDQFDIVLPEDLFKRWNGI